MIARVPPEEGASRDRLPVVDLPSGSNPVCPHCEAELTAVAARRLDEPLGVATMFCCPSCGKVLGVGHRKGFFMG